MVKMPMDQTIPEAREGAVCAGASGKEKSLRGAWMLLRTPVNKASRSHAGIGNR